MIGWFMRAQRGRGIFIGIARPPGAASGTAHCNLRRRALQWKGSQDAHAPSGTPGHVDVDVDLDVDADVDVDVDAPVVPPPTHVRGEGGGGGGRLLSGGGGGSGTQQSVYQK